MKKRTLELYMTLTECAQLDAVLFRCRVYALRRCFFVRTKRMGCVQTLWLPVFCNKTF